MDLIYIQHRIHQIRGMKVLLDFDLAILYGVETKRLKEAVRRNIDRFPPDFMFELTIDEQHVLRTQFASLEQTGKGKHSKYPPFAFTEQGVAMLSGVLTSERAVQMNIAIMRAFIAVRKRFMQYEQLSDEMNLICEQVKDHTRQIGLINETIEVMIQTPLEIPRAPIGFMK